jgi:hypothetical protein
VSVRGQLKSIQILIADARTERANDERLDPQNAHGLAERLAELGDRIERLPQISVVRPAIIAIRNVVVSLRQPTGPASLDEELIAVEEVIHEMLADKVFGISVDELRTKVAEALHDAGVVGCLACAQKGFRIELVYSLTKPFPSDPAVAPLQIPSALVVCQRCGFSSTHDLAILGVITAAVRAHRLQLHVIEPRSRQLTTSHAEQQAEGEKQGTSVCDARTSVKISVRSATLTCEVDL